MNKKQILNGNPPGSRPPEYTGGIGDAGADNLIAFVRRGGVLICLGNASAFALNRFDLPVKNALADPSDETPFYCPGSILQVELDPTHPLGYGRPSHIGIYFARSPVFSVDNPSVSIARFPGFNPLMSGFLSGHEHIQGKTALVDAPVEKGRVILFSFRPQHRAQPHTTFKLLFNAIFYAAATPNATIR